ncbi:MAG: DUF2306 domain-containing protein [Reyranellaceae bacterium]
MTTRPERGFAAAGIGLAAVIGIAALGSAIGLPALPEPLALLDERLPGIFGAHMLASGLGLILLPWILLVRHRPSLHRVLGRIAAGLLLVGAATSLPSALQSEAVPLARLGFFTQGTLCLVFLIEGVRAIRAQNARRHGQLMVRVAALVSGAIVLRVLLAAAMSLGWSFDAAYAALAWLSWALPLAMVGLWQMRRLRSAIRA